MYTANLPRSEENDGANEVFGNLRPFDGAAFDARGGIIARGGRDLRLAQRHAGRNRVDGDVVRAELARQRLRQREQPGLRVLVASGYAQSLVDNADATTDRQQDEEFEALVLAGRFAIERGMILHMGHGLTYRNVQRVARIPGVCELNIGHSIIARALSTGLDQAVRDMIAAMQQP